MENIAKNADNRQVCCMDFLINDVGRASLKQALTIERVYDHDRITGLMYCTYKTDNLLNSEINDFIELFELHEYLFGLSKFPILSSLPSYTVLIILIVSSSERIEKKSEGVIISFFSLTPFD